MKNRIKTYLKRFFKTVEVTDCEPRQEEMIDGQAFSYRHYALNQPKTLSSGDTITATMHDDLGNESFQVSEACNMSGVVDTVAIFRAKEALGMTNVIGAAFGKKK